MRLDAVRLQIDGHVRQIYSAKELQALRKDGGATDSTSQRSGPGITKLEVLCRRQD